MSRLECSDQLADEERQHGDHDGERHRRVREHEARRSGGEQTADHGGNKFRRDEEGSLTADLQQEAPAEMDPDTEGAPADTDERHGVHHGLCQDAHRDERRIRAGFDPHESNHAQEADDEEEVDVWRAPAE